MEEEEDPSYACSLLQLAAQEARQESGSGRVFLTEDMVQKLAEVFGGKNSDQVAVDVNLWEELSLRRVSVGDVVNGLVGTMEKSGAVGVEAAHVYLGFLLAPECPSYSLFSPLAFQVLLQCIINSCKASGAVSPNVKTVSNNRKKSQKKGKRLRSAEQEQTSDEGIKCVPAVGLEDILPVVYRLRAVLHVVNLKEHQAALKNLLEFLVELPHLVADLQEPTNEERSQKCRKGAAARSTSDSNEVIRLTFFVLRDALESVHGDPAVTAVLILKLLTPSLLLTGSGGSAQQKSQIRTSALDFVVKCMLDQGPPSFQTAGAALTRYLCFKSPEKTDARAQAVESIIFLVKALRTLEQRQFGKFVSKLARSKARFRLLALDLCAALFAHLPDPLGLDNAETEQDVHERSAWGMICLEAVLQRCSDKVPTIRARALATLAHVIDLLSAQVRQRKCLQDLFSALGSGGTSASDAKTSWDTPFEDIGNRNLFTVPGAESHTPTMLSPGAHRGDMSSLMRKRCSDDKVAVRKAALSLTTKVTILMGKSPDEQTLKAMGFACSDSMLSIRKAALSALSEVTRSFCSSKKVVMEWLQSALPLVIDNESTVQEETVELFRELVLDPIASISVLKITSRQLAAVLFAESGEPEQSLPPGVLHFLAGLGEGSDTVHYIRRVCARLGKTKCLRASVVMALQNIINASEELGRKKRFSDYKRVGGIVQGAWFLLSELSIFLPKIVGWDFLRTHWQLLGKQGPKVDEENTPVPFSSCSKRVFQDTAAWAASRVYLLQTIANVAVELPADAAADLADELLHHLEDFNMHPAEVGAHVNALTILCKQKAATGEEGGELVAEWVGQLLHKAEAILKAYLSSRHEDKDASFQTPRHKSCSARRRSQRRNGMQESTEIVTAVFTVGAVVLVSPVSDTGGISSLLQKLIATANLVTDPALGAQTWVTLGKLCLADDKLAKRLIPLFVQELESTQSAANRNNIMVTLTDFCVRYTALIESYIPKLTKTLRDSCEIVRRQTFVLLARLLQRDYVKWRGMLFHRFLLALVDESPKICQMADFLFGSLLKTKAPLLAYNSFVEAIFVLNDYQGQSCSSTVLQSSESERDLFSLRGNGQTVANKRMHIYTTLIKQMSPEHLLATSAKLCAEVLAGAADGLIDISTTSGKCVVEDALKILAAKEMRLGGNKTCSSAAENAEEEDGAAAFAAMKGKVVTQLAKRNLVQNAIPIFIELKRLLERNSSPLLGVLMECMRSMLKDYKNEMEEILVADKQLQKEIMYDMQKHDAAKARSKVEAATTNAVRSEQGQPASHNSEAVDGETSADMGKQTIDKENRRPVLTASKPPASAVRRRGLETPAAVTRVTWLDQTPELRGAFASPTARNQSAFRSKENCGGGVISHRSLVGAAGDIAAAATAATVLREAATGKSTPLKAMSLPRLRPGASAFAQRVAAAAATENEGELDSVRRRLG